MIWGEIKQNRQAYIVGENIGNAFLGEFFGVINTILYQTQDGLVLGMDLAQVVKDEINLIPVYDGVVVQHPLF